MALKVMNLEHHAGPTVVWLDSFYLLTKRYTQQPNLTLFPCLICAIDSVFSLYIGACWFLCVWFSFFSTLLSAWLGRTSLIWRIFMF